MKELPKILIFIDWYLPGFKAGGPIRSCVNMVSHLKQNFQFYIVTRDTDYTDKTPYASVTANSWNEVEGAQVYYLFEEALKSRKIRALLREVEPDIIYVNGIYSYYFSILPLVISRQLGYRKILVAGRGMLAQSAIQVKGVKKKLFFKMAKFYNLYRNVTFHATNVKEEADIREVLGDRVLVKVAPNLPEVWNDFSAVPEHRLKVAGELHLVSIARIAPEKNTLFALELLCNYKGKGKIRFDLYGPIYSEAYWQECKELMAQMPPNVEVSYKGSLEKEKVNQTLQQYHALFMPTKGENFGHVILESLLAGCPVLISDQTPWHKLQEKAIGYSLPLAGTTAYQKAFSELLQLDQEQYNIIAENAFRYATSYCLNETILESNKALFRFD